MRNLQQNAFIAHHRATTLHLYNVGACITSAIRLGCGGFSRFRWGVPCLVDEVGPPRERHCVSNFLFFLSFRYTPIFIFFPGGHSNV